MAYYTNGTNTSYFGNNPTGAAFVLNESWAIQSKTLAAIYGINTFSPLRLKPAIC